MKGVLILLVTAIVVCVGNRTQGVHKHRHGKTGHKPERDTGSITLKPGTAKNKLFPEYGTNFRYIGEVKNGLDRVTVVTSIPIPKYSDIELRPIVFNNSTEDLWRHGARTRGYPQHETYIKCNRVLAQAKFYQSQQEELQFLLRQLLTHDLYSVLPELNQTPSMYNHGPSYNIRPVELSDPYGTKFIAKTVNDTAQIRGKRGFESILAKAIPGLITLAVESVSSYIKGRQQQRINTAVEELRSDDNKIKNDLKQYRNELLMYGRYNLKSLRGIINTINALHDKQTYFERAVKQKDFNFRKSDMDAVNYNFEVMMYMKNIREEHVVTYREAVKAARDFLDGIAIVTQGRLPRSLISDNQLREILGKVDAMVKRNYPDYVLAAKHISHYRDMKMVTFSVDQQAHSLILTFPAFIKNYKQPPLSLYEVETVPVPIINKNVKADSYSQVRIEKSYIAAGTDYYIQLRMSELLMCKSIRHIYYCEELFVIKHKSKHSCVSAIFYNLGPATVTKNCKFDYYFNTTVPPVILDGGRDVLLANFHGPRALKCSSVNGGLSKPAPEIVYAVVNREFLCDCQLDLEHASVLRQLSSCANSSSSKMHMEFTINLAFWELFKKRSPNSASNIQPQHVEEEQVFSVDLYDPKIGKLDQPVDLEKFMETMGTDGQKMPTDEEREAEQPMQKIMPRWLNNILVMTCTAMTTVLMIIILVLLAKHFKMKALVSMIAIQTVPPPAEAVNLTAAMMSAMIAPDPAIGTKVVCAYPVAVIWQNILGYLVLAYAITQFFRPVTWCKGYKYNKKCALYMFVYDEDHERYSPLKIMSLKGQMHNYRMKYTGEGISLTLVRSWTYDTMTISWGGVQVMDKSDPINLPATVTVALRHKIMTRRIAQQLGEVQYMLKQGSSWHDITDYYRARKRAVNLRVGLGDKGVTSSPKKVRKEKSYKKTKVQEEPVEV